MTNQQGAPEALRPIQRFNNIVGLMNPEARGLYVRYEDHVAALVEAQQAAQPEQQPFGWIKQSEIDSSKDFVGSINLWRRQYDCDVPVYLAQQPAPSAAAAWKDHQTREVVNQLRDCAVQYHATQQLRDRLLHILGPMIDWIRAAQQAPQPSPTPQADSQPAQVRDYPPLTIAEARDLTCMLAGAPWPDEMLPELLQLLAIYDNLRSDNARPVDPASLPSDMAQAVISTGRNPAVSEQTAEPTGFWEWVRQAYRAPESTSFTVHNMAVAYRAGRDADRAARATADSVTAAGPDRWREMLQELEWACGGYNRYGDCEDICPCCENWKSDGHKADCRLAELLATTTPPAQAADSALKNHQIAALVNELRDIAIQYHGTQQLRERIAHAVVPALKAQAADSVLEDAARGMAAEYKRWIDFFHKGNGDYNDFLRIELNPDAARKQGANHD